MNYVRQARAALLVQMPSLKDDPDLLELYTLLMLTTGEQTTREHVHDAWALWRDKSAPMHRSLIPFEMLSGDVQELDEPYAAAIRRAARFYRGHV